MIALVTLYVREGCHLCEIALAALERLGAGRSFALEVVDIEGDEALHRRYLERIPVVALDGEELCDFEVEEDVVIAALARAASASPGGAAGAGHVVEGAGGPSSMGAA